MLYSLEDTIVAIATARAAGGLRGIVRISGDDAFSALETCGIPFREFLCETFKNRFSPALNLTRLSGFPAFRFTHEILLQDPCCLAVPTVIPAAVFCWGNGASYTGQACAEIHTFGGLPVLEKLTDFLCRAPRARLAQPGEYTLRAFLNGRLDLTQAEAVLGVINATDDEKLDVALEQLAGGLATPLGALRESLFDLLGHLEAGFDFAEEDISFIAPEEIACQIADALARLESLAHRMQSREAAAGEIRVVLCGPANVGKSSLFNALLGSQHAVVYDAPGTTRDYLAARWSVAGSGTPLECTLIDTAGLAEFAPADTLNSRAVELARKQNRTADIRILCRDARDFVENLSENSPDADENTSLTVLTRADLLTASQRKMASGLDAVLASVREENGVAALKTRICEMLAAFSTGETHVVAATAARCRESVRVAAESLARAAALADTPFEELLAAEIRTALDALGIVVGATYTEDILDSIFSRFCVGK